MAQTLVWGLWGAAGGLLRPLRTPAAWLLGVALCLPLGHCTGFLLNAVGWAGEGSVDAGGFLPGAGVWESFTRIITYSASTSATLDLVRGITNAAIVALIGLPVLRALRDVVGERVTAAVTAAPPAPRVRDEALARRHRSDQLATLWTPTEGEPE